MHRIDLREETESTYRKTGDSYVWHFSEKCSRWPTADYLQLEIRPNIGMLCGECRSKQSRIGVH